MKKELMFYSELLTAKENGSVVFSPEMDRLSSDRLKTLLTQFATKPVSVVVNSKDKTICILGNTHPDWKDLYGTACEDRHKLNEQLDRCEKLSEKRASERTELYKLNAELLEALKGLTGFVEQYAYSVDVADYIAEANKAITKAEGGIKI